MRVMLSELPVRASVVFGVFLAFGAMIFALVRAYGAPFLFFSIFGTIALDIFCVCRVYHLYGPYLIFSSQAIGPLYPFSNYKIINSILMSASSYAAIALVCCFFLFPETVNHAYLGIIPIVLDKIKAMLEFQDHLLAPQPGDFTPGCPKLKALLGIRAAVAGMYQTCDYPSYHLIWLLFTSLLLSGGIESSSSKRV
jgi:hypothetical protein